MEKTKEKWFFIHQDYIGYNNEKFEENKFYIDITKIKSIKDIVNEYCKKLLENQKLTKKEDIEDYKNTINKYFKKEFIEDLVNNKIILYKQEEYKIKKGKIIKYEPMQILIQTIFENIMEK